MTAVLVAERYAVRARGLTSADAARLLPVAAGFSAVLSIALVSVKLWRTPHFAYAPTVVMWALSTFGASLVCRVLLRRASRSSPKVVNARGLTSWLLAIELGLIMLPVPVLLLVKSVPEEDMTGWLWPLVNKRWLLALYNLSIATFLLLPVAIEHWRSRACADADISAAILERPVAPVHRVTAIGGALVMFAWCWFVAGMPWHLERHHRSIEWHEQMHFGALQAISKGYLPAVGPAATPYGPGSQVLTYSLAKLMGPLDLVSIRQAWVAQHLIAVLLVGLAAWWWLGIVPALAVMCLAIAYSPLAFFYTLADGTYTGFFGWANPLRYLAPLIVVPAVARAAMQDSKGAMFGLLGGIWGIGAWLAQESLTTTTTAVALVLMLLCLTRTVPAPRAVRIARNLVIGFACVVIPVIGYYAAHGAARMLLQAYFAYPRAVAAGFGNDWWPPQDVASPARLSYYLTLPFLIGCAIPTLWRLPEVRLVTPLDERRTRFLAFVCVQLVCYQTALLRSDSTHLMNAMIALPFVLVLGFIDLPRWVGQSIGRWQVRIAFVLIAAIVYPGVWLTADLHALRAPLRRFQAISPAAEAGRERAAVSFSRTRPLAPDEPIFLGDPALSVREFDTFASDLRAVIGARKTYVVRLGSIAGSWIAGGLIEFVADLTPAPHPLGGDLFTFNDQVRSHIADHIAAHPSDYEAFIGPSWTDPEARAFLESHAGAVKLEERLGDSTVCILLSSIVSSRP